MTLYNDLINGKESLSLVGLGYVGMPIAVAFAKHLKVIGFDINAEKVSKYLSGTDPTREVGDDAVAESGVDFTCDEKRLKEAKFHIVAVPTPINKDKTPDLRPVMGASRTLGRNLQKGSVIVYESTVYPGVTEEICVPILEEASGLKWGKDFFVGYSPERINPGDKEHRLETITKIVSADNADTLETVSAVYSLVAKSGVYRAESIKVAEAAKVIENSQRDINIAFMNELSVIFDKLGIDTKAVLEAAGTKWNFLNFKPGLVGGHCIGVDPYYLTYKAEQSGYRSRIILAGRQINDDMGKYIAGTLVKKLISTGSPVKNARVAILGFTFKENCPDTRNTKVVDIIDELKEYGISPLVYDPIADSEEAFKEYGIHFCSKDALTGLDAVVIAVSHREFEALDVKALSEMLSGKIVFDIKGMFGKEECESAGLLYWRL